MGLVEIELERHRWNVWRCGCGATTEHLVPELRRVVRAKTPSAADVRHITPHVCGPGRLSAPAAAVTQVVLAALAAGATEVTRDELLALLRALVDDAGISAGPGVAGVDAAAGDDRADRADRADRKRVARCRAVAREATWLLASRPASSRCRTSTGALCDAGSALARR